jgi:hypothetical protein
MAAASPAFFGMTGLAFNADKSNNVTAVSDAAGNLRRNESAVCYHNKEKTAVVFNQIKHITSQ